MAGAITVQKGKALAKWMLKKGKKIGKDGKEGAEKILEGAKKAGKEFKDSKVGESLAAATKKGEKLVKKYPKASFAAAVGGGAGASELLDDDGDEAPKKKKKKRPYLED